MPPGLWPTRRLRALLRSFRPANPAIFPWCGSGSSPPGRKLPVAGCKVAEPIPFSAWEPSISRRAYADAFATIREYIEAGDTYQVNFTFRLRAGFSGDERTFYHDLCRSQRAPFCAYLDLGRHQILSASPELFFSLRDGVLTARPMKGTRPRGRWSGEDERHARSLHTGPKERAENVMIVDLLRNDLGRISEAGSVEVLRLWEVERYETVLQLTSTLRSRPRPGVGLVQLMAALFPCGSVTGAPKVRTAQIIAEPGGFSARRLHRLYRLCLSGPGGAFQRGHSHRVDRPPQRHGRVRGGGWNYPRFLAPGGVWGMPGQGQGVAGAQAAIRAAGNFAVRSGQGLLSPRPPPAAPAPLRRAIFDFRCETEAVVRALERESAGFGPRDYRVRLTLGRRGGIEVRSSPLAPLPSRARVAISGRRGGPPRSNALSQDHPPPPLRAPAPAPSRLRRRHHAERARRSHRMLHR